MKSVDCTKQLVDESPVKRRKGWPTTKSHQQKEYFYFEKQFNKTFILNRFHLIPQQGLFCKLISHSYVTVNIVISSTIELLKWTWLLLARKDRRLLSQLDDFDQNMVIGNAAIERQEKTVVSEGTNDWDFTVGTSHNSIAIVGSTVNAKTLEKCSNERVCREMGEILDTECNFDCYW